MSFRLVRAFHRALRSHTVAVEAARDGDVRDDASNSLRISIQDLLDLHGEASSAVVLMVMAICCLMPVGGIGTVLSLAMVVLAWKWSQSIETRTLPDRVARVQLSPKWTKRTLHAFSWLYRLAARWLRPRQVWLFHSHARNWWSLWIMIMAVLIFLPIPFGNILPGLSLIFLGLAWISRDGLVLIVSKMIGVGALFFAWTFAHLIVEGFIRFNAVFMPA